MDDYQVVFPTLDQKLPRLLYPDLNLPCLDLIFVYEEGRKVEQIIQQHHDTMMNMPRIATFVSTWMWWKSCY